MFANIIGLVLISSSAISCGNDDPYCPCSEPDLPAYDTIAYLDIPIRAEDALTGSEFAEYVDGLSVSRREIVVKREVLSGNVPSFSRTLKPLIITQEIDTVKYELVFFTTYDYIAIGSDEDYMYMPMTPTCAQYLADSLNCTLPAKKMVDMIYSAAEDKLYPQPIPPSTQMTTIPVFMQHTDSVTLQIHELGIDRSANHITGGHKKDIIISNKIYSTDRTYDRVVIYGWHRSENDPIQPVYNGHSADYADYSHGVRLIANEAFINEESVWIDSILMDPELSVLLSHEGVITKPYYPVD